MEHGGRVEADGWGRQHATLELELELELERARAGEAGSESLHELAVWWQPTTKVHDVFSIGPFVFTTLSSVFIPLTLYPSFHRLPLSLCEVSHLGLSNQQPELRIPFVT